MAQQTAGSAPHRAYSFGRRVAGGKYGNRKTELNGKVFDSAKEAKRYAELQLMERAGQIWGLQTQVPFPLIPGQRDPDGHAIRGVTYVADFVYWTDSKTRVVEDAKGYRTEVYKIKKKLMLQIHGIWIREV